MTAFTATSLPLGTVTLPGVTVSFISSSVGGFSTIAYKLVQCRWAGTARQDRDRPERPATSAPFAAANMLNFRLLICSPNRTFFVRSSASFIRRKLNRPCSAFGFLNRFDRADKTLLRVRDSSLRRIAPVAYRWARGAAAVRASRLPRPQFRASEEAEAHRPHSPEGDRGGSRQIDAGGNGSHQQTRGPRRVRASTQTPSTCSEPDRFFEAVRRLVSSHSPYALRSAVCNIDFHDTGNQSNQ